GGVCRVPDVNLERNGSGQLGPAGRLPRRTAGSRRSGMGNGAGPRARIGVLVLEEQRLVAEALGALLQADAELELVGTPTDPRLAIAHARATAPDVLVLGYSFMPLGGAGAAAQLRAELPELKILVVGRPSDEEGLLACIHEGA